MKKSLKKLLSVCMILVLAFAMTACGDDDKQVAKDVGDAPAAEAPAADVTKNEEPAQDDSAEAEKEDAAAASESLKLVGGESILEGTETVEEETNDDGSYFIHSEGEGGMLAVYQQGGLSLPGDDVSEEEYALNLATGLPKRGANDDARVKPANEYSENISYPVYVASFTSGGNEDTAQWWVFVTFTDSKAYLYGICTPIDAEDDAGKLSDEVFPNLRLE